MRFSERWLREWVNPDITTDELVAQLTMAGLEVDSVEPVAADFTNVVVAHVEHTEVHPDASKLTVCQVRWSESNSVRVVCGASNVTKGLKVALAKIGASLPNGLQIKATHIRGQQSHGMLCSSQELGLEESSDGILELPADAPVGESVREYMQLDDTVLEVDLTPNRGDCLSIAGLAREVGVLNRTEVTPATICVQPSTIERTFPVKVNARQQCPHYIGRVIEGVNLDTPTPLWMTERLRRSGIRSIDPVVDVTNYVLLELGQPMHAFDLESLVGGICVRFAKDDEMLTLLGGQEVTLNKDVLVIADENNALAMAGVMGGAESGVRTETKHLFLESAFFDPIAIAGKARAYGLHTDSSHRFERGVDYQLQLRAMERATELLLSIVGGEAGPITTVGDSDLLQSKQPITLRETRLNQILGFEFPPMEIAEILERLGMDVSGAEGEWKVFAPSYRFDIEREIDLIEELGRIYGYNRLPSALPQFELNPDLNKPESHVSLSRLKHWLADRDYREVITYSFVDETLQALIDPAAKQIALANPLSADMSVMRTNLWVGLLKTAIYNTSRQQSRLRLFESGLCFQFDLDQLQQRPYLAGLAMGPLSSGNWCDESRDVDFFDVKGDLESLLDLIIPVIDLKVVAREHPALQPGQSAQLVVGDEVIGWIGALSPNLQQKLGFTSKVFLFELGLYQLTEKKLPKFVVVSRYPEVSRDLAFIVDKSVAAATLMSQVVAAGGEWLRDVKIFDLYQGEGIDAGKKSLALGLTLQHPSRTLKDSEVNEVVSRVITRLKQELDVILRD